MMTKKKDLVKAGAVLREFGMTSVSQREMLRKFGIKTESIDQKGRGYTHWITQESADKLRGILNEKKHGPEQAQPPAPEEPTPEPPTPEPQPPVGDVNPTLTEALSRFDSTVAVLSEEILALRQQQAALALSLGRSFESLSKLVRQTHENGARLLDELGVKA